MVKGSRETSEVAPDAPRRSFGIVAQSGLEIENNRSGYVEQTKSVKSLRLSALALDYILTDRRVRTLPLTRPVSPNLSLLGHVPSRLRLSRNRTALFHHYDPDFSEHLAQRPVYPAGVVSKISAQIRPSRGKRTSSLELGTFSFEDGGNLPSLNNQQAPLAEATVAELCIAFVGISRPGRCCCIFTE